MRKLFHTEKQGSQTEKKPLYWPPAQILKISFHMNLFAFELGRVKDICLAELYSVLGAENFVEMIGSFAIFKVKETNNFQHDLQDRLGGTIKIAQIVESFQPSENGPKKQIEDSLERILTDHFKNQSGKIPFAITTINIPDDPKVFLKFFLTFSKKILKSLGLNSRFVNKPWVNPTSAQIYKSRSVEKGADITILANQKSTDTWTNRTIYITKTVSIQNIDLYSVRDYEKPFRDPTMGMLPPKLAQIMLNLADPQEKAKTVYDPFCGSGTILIESLIRGKNVVGSDIDQKAVGGTISNLRWISEKLKNRQTNGEGAISKFRVFAKDATTLSAKDFKKAEDTAAQVNFTPDVIVSETYLGEPMSYLPKREVTDKIFSSIAGMHESWLQKAAKILPKNSKIVICIPAFRAGPGIYLQFPNFNKIAKRSGLTIIEQTNKKPLIYDREGQIVAREIVVMQNSIENN